MTGEAQNQNLILGVEYDGQSGVQQFLSALSPIAGQVDELFSKMSAQAGGSNIWATKGRDIAEQMYRGLQGALAGFSDLTGSSFGEKILSGAGLTPAQVRNQRELASQLTKMRDEFARQGVPAATQRNYSQTEVMGLRQVQAEISQATRRYEDLTAARTRAQQQLDRMRNLTTTADGRLDPALQFAQGSAKSGVQWSKAARLVSEHAGFQLPQVPTTATGMPSEAAARKVIQDELNRSISTMTRSVAAMDQQMRVYNAAPAPKVEQVQQAVQKAVAPTPTEPTRVQQQIIEARAAGLSQRDVAARAGTSRYQVQQVDQTYAAEIARIREATAAREAELAAIKASANPAAREPRPLSAGALARTDMGLTQLRQLDPALAEMVATFRTMSQQMQANAAKSSGAAGDWKVPPNPEANFPGAAYTNAERARLLGPGVRSGAWDESYARERYERTVGAGQSQTQSAADQSALIQLARRTLPDTGAYSAAERAAAARAEYLNRNLAWLDPSTSRADLVNRDGTLPRFRTAAGADWWTAGVRSGEVPTRGVDAAGETFNRGGGFGAGFSRGFGTSPDNDRPFAEMVGQTARVSLFYGAAYRGITMITQALSSMTQETLAYEDSLTALNVVTGRSRSENEQAASDLGEVATSAGFTSSQGVSLGAGALGLYGAASADKATQERTMQLSAEVATRMARVSGADPMATQTQLAGALRSMGWGIERLPELEDTISYISRQTGQAPTQLLGAVANISTLGSQAGFTPQMLAALTAQVGTTTGQNPEATAGQFRQLLSRNASEIAPQASQITGTDLSGMDLQEIFAAVSKLDLSTDQLNRFASLFGKGGSQQVATILTQQYGNIQGLASSAQGAEGFGKAAFEQTMASFGNQLRQLGAEVGELGVKLVELGFVDWLVLVVKAVGGVVQAGNTLLDILNMIPRPLRSVALALGEIYAASLVMRRLGWTTAGAHAAGTVSRVGQVAGAIAANPGQVLTQSLQLSTLRSAINAPFQAGGIFRLSDEARGAQTGLLGSVRARTGLTNVGLLGAAGAVYGAGALVKQGFDMDSEAQAAVETARLALASADTAEALKEVAAQARAAASGLEEQGIDGLKAGDVGNLIPSIMSSLLTGSEQKKLEDIDRQATARAAAMDEAQASLEAADKSNTFRDFTTDGLTSTLSDLEKSGYSAAERLALLNKAMFEFSDSAKGATDAVAVIQKGEFWGVGQSVGQKAVDAINRQRDFFQVDEDSEFSKNWLTRPFSPVRSDAQREADAGVKAFTLSSDQEASVRETLSSVTQDALTEVGSDGIIDESDAAAIKARALATLKSKLGTDAWKKVVDGGYEEIFAATMNSLVQATLDEFGGKPTRENLGAYLQILPTVAGAKRDAVSATTGNDADGNRSYLAELEGRKADTLNLLSVSGQSASDEELRGLRELDGDIATAKRAVLADRLAEIRSWADAQKAFLSDADVLGQLRVDQAALDQIMALTQAQANADASNTDILTAKGMSRADAASSARYAGAAAAAGYNFSNDSTRDLDAQQAQANRAKAAEILATRQNRASAGVYGGNALGQASVQVSNASLGLDALAKELGDDKDDSSAYWAAVGGLKQAQYSYAQAQVQNANANALSRVDPRDTLGGLRVQMANVRREMSLLSPGQQGSQLEQLNQLQQQYEEALVSQANARASSKVAGHSSGLQQARVGLANAQRDLDVQLKGTEGYYTSLSALRQAQATLAEQERAQADRVRRLGSDLTDPVEQAKLDVEAAMKKYSADKAAGEGKDTLAQDKLDLRGAQNQQEAAAFQQRLSDVQVAEDLGRISHTQYMSYLQNEHDRLSSIANRTRQQQEELNQIDQLMKAAGESLNGQFNLGDIDLPTVYEVRRAVGSGAPTQVADYSGSNNTVTINGADFQSVIDWLTTTLGKGATVTRAASTRKA